MGMDREKPYPEFAEPHTELINEFKRRWKDIEKKDEKEGRNIDSDVGDHSACAGV